MPSPGGKMGVSLGVSSSSQSVFVSLTACLSLGVSHSFASRLSPIALILLFTLSFDNVLILFWLFRGIPAVLFLVCVCVLSLMLLSYFLCAPHLFVLFPQLHAGLSISSFFSRNFMRVPHFSRDLFAYLDYFSYLCAKFQNYGRD